jgi:predicted transcriptional regulator
MIHYLTDHGYIKKENGIYAVTSIGTDWANALKEMFPKPITQNHERQTA